jgi:hypothetical protein
MANKLSKEVGFILGIDNPDDPFRVIIRRMINAYANNFKGIVDLQPTRKITPGVIDFFGKLTEIKKEKIGLPTGYEDRTKGKASMLNYVKVFEYFGFVENKPVKAGGGKLIDSYDFTPLMNEIIDQVKTGQSADEALESAVPSFRPTPIKAPAARRIVGQASAEALDDIELAKDAQKFLEDKGRLPPPPQPAPETMTAREAKEIILNHPRKQAELEKNRSDAEKRATSRLVNTPLDKVEGVAGRLSKADPSAMEKIGRFLGKNIVKGGAPILLGGLVGLAAKGAEALDYATSALPTGRNPEDMSTEQMKALLSSVEGGGLTDEQRLATAEMPPEARQAEYLTEQLADRARPMEQGAAMQEDIQRSTRFQDEMKRLMQRQQQKQGTAQ